MSMPRVMSNQVSQVHNTHIGTAKKQSKVKD